MRYLLVDAASDSVLAEYESLEDVLATMKRVRQEQPGRELLVAWLEEHHGELVSTQSIVRARALSEREGFALYRR